MDERLKIAIEAVKKTGDYLRSRFLKEHRVAIKKDQTVLLSEDLEAEKILISIISKKFPKDSFFTEESENEIRSKNIWVFDPLCGSYSYLRGVETWSVSVAFIQDGQYKIGVVYQPYTKDIYYSLSSQGAFMNGKKINCSKIKNISEAFVSIEHGVFNNENVELKTLIKEIKRLRVGHGSGAELSYVAAGFIDAVIKTDQTLEHFAGGRAVLEAAGGVFVDFLGKRAPTYFDKNKKINYVACANIDLARAILKKIVK